MDAHQRAWLSLQGLSVGDTFGERFFGPPEDALGRDCAAGTPRTAVDLHRRHRDGTFDL